MTSIIGSIAFTLAGLLFAISGAPIYASALMLALSGIFLMVVDIRKDL